MARAKGVTYVVDEWARPVQAIMICSIDHYIWTDNILSPISAVYTAVTINYSKLISNIYFTFVQTE